eukprot:scaffold74045_cov62-Phaeocystis_antarctica.AAC.1
MSQRSKSQEHPIGNREARFFPSRFLANGIYLVPVSIIAVNLSDTHSLRSRYGQCGRRAWRGPGGSPRALGIQLQLARTVAAPRGPPLLLLQRSGARPR